MPQGVLTFQLQSVIISYTFGIKGAEMAKKKSIHYVDNKKFLAAMTEWRKLCKDAEEQGEENPPLTNYIGCLLYTSPSPRDQA